MATGMRTWISVSGELPSVCRLSFECTVTNLQSLSKHDFQSKKGTEINKNYTAHIPQHSDPSDPPINITRRTYTPHSPHTPASAQTTLCTCSVLPLRHGSSAGGELDCAGAELRCNRALLRENPSLAVLRVPRADRRPCSWWCIHTMGVWFLG